MLMINEWSTAKSRVDEEISMRIERNLIVSDPTKIAIMMQD